MKLVLLFVFLLCTITCSKETSQNQVPVSKNMSNKKECIETIEIRRLLIQLNKEDNLISIKIDTLIKLFGQNEEEIQSDSCIHFPSKENDGKIFYNFVDKLIISASNDWKFISQYIQIAKNVRTNVEWSEVLTEDFHKIAMSNPEQFLNSYNISDKIDKEYILNALGFLYEYDYLEVFKEKIIQIENPKLINTKSEIINEINKMLGVQ